MTRIDFYTEVDKPADFACRLAHTVYKKGERLTVWLADGGALASFSTRLWCVSDTAFVPHCALDDPLAPETPVVLTERLPDSAAGVLLNLGPSYPDAPERFSRILEIVGRDEAALAAARERFRAYRARGFAIEHHDMSQRAP
ncbi:DNA polymerase III chi subunit [Crenobacter luteus]|uniref:DNA polymerase III subunit chi n=1 Tax=Crenobacter luteus TaxID=1452487 RepID=A0A165F5D5_9NEIS|nr:DNA polymerase III subunit chi [Crenobacter luteus]KZE31257.1 DNA polymerase III subunit chi [Crenobacter luteus]TCP11609.1 DNA polymerase III chi subunit [Crenobacter luteus]